MRDISLSYDYLLRAKYLLLDSVKTTFPYKRDVGDLELNYLLKFQIGCIQQCTLSSYIHL